MKGIWLVSSFNYARGDVFSDIIHQVKSYLPYFEVVSHSRHERILFGPSAIEKLQEHKLKNLSRGETRSLLASSADDQQMGFEDITAYHTNVLSDQVNYQKVIDQSNGVEVSVEELNLLGLSHFMQGQASRASEIFSEALERPFSSAHLSTAKNLFWVKHVLNDDNFHEIEDKMFDILHDFSDKKLRPTGATFYDLPLNQEICNYNITTRKRQRTPYSWRHQYMDLLKKSPAGFLFSIRIYLNF